jgi:hypothetical protein
MTATDHIHEARKFLVAARAEIAKASRMEPNKASRAVSSILHEVIVLLGEMKRP